MYVRMHIFIILQRTPLLGVINAVYNKILQNYIIVYSIVCMHL